MHLGCGVLVRLHFRHDGFLVFVREQVRVASHLHGHHQRRVHVLQLLWVSELEAELALVLRDDLEHGNVGARMVRHAVNFEQDQKIEKNEYLRDVLDTRKWQRIDVVQFIKVFAQTVFNEAQTIVGHDDAAQHSRVNTNDIEAEALSLTSN